jgi:hypothetical protein
MQRAGVPAASNMYDPGSCMRAEFLQPECRMKLPQLIPILQQNYDTAVCDNYVSRFIIEYSSLLDFGPY